jgi:hypothetical protein
LIQNIGVNVALGKTQKKCQIQNDWFAIASKIMKFFPALIQN